MLLVEVTEKKLREAILHGEYRAGERLVESELIEKFNVSKTVVREVLRNLGATGLIGYIPKKGHSVQKFSIQDIKNLYDLIIRLEGYGCELAVPLFKKMNLDSIIKLNRKMKQAALEEDYKEYTELNIRFHAIFATISGNHVLKEIIDNLRTRIMTYRYLSLVIPDTMAKHVKEHEAIIKGVIAKDANKVKLEMRSHIECAKNNLISSLEKSQLI